MSNDKQLNGVAFDDVFEKRRLGQALSAKEFAVLAGISYSTAREWFHSPGFPVFRGKVFWQDFSQWRKAQMGLCSNDEQSPPQSATKNEARGATSAREGLPRRAFQILSEAD